jgi:hypothetical protein
MLEALMALQDWDELERFVLLARRHVPGLAILGPCCDRAEGLVARAHGDQMAATAALERALAGFDAFHAGAEAAVTRRLLALEPPSSPRPKSS